MSKNAFLDSNHGFMRHPTDVTVPMILNGSAAYSQTHQTLPLKLDTLKLEYCVKVFDYLGINDLIALSRTCKRLYRVVSCILSENYIDLEVSFRENGLNLHYKHDDHSYLNYPYWKEEKFCVKHLNRLLCKEIDLAQFCNMQSILPPQLHVSLGGEFSVSRLQCLKNLFAKVKTLQFEQYRLRGNFYELLAFCCNLKRLNLVQDITEDYTNTIGDNEEWLRRTYPTIECLDLEYCAGVDESLLKTFLEINPNIRKLRFSIHTVNWSEDLFMHAKVELEEMKFSIGNINNQTIVWLNNLHERGFYKRLHLQCIYLKIGRNIELSSIRGLVEWSSINVPNFRCDWVYPSLSNLNDLEVLRIHECEQIADFFALPSALKSLKRLQMKRASFNEIWPFICQSVKLKEIVVHYQLRGGIHFNDITNIIDLFAVNKEREKLANAKKVTIYVDEEIYLATKWALKETDCRLIRFARIQSFNNEPFKNW